MARKYNMLQQGHFFHSLRRIEICKPSRQPSTLIQSEGGSGSKNESGVARTGKRYSLALLRLAGLPPVPPVACPLPLCPVPALLCAGDVAALPLLCWCVVRAGLVAVALSLDCGGR